MKEMVKDLQAKGTSKVNEEKPPFWRGGSWGT